MPVRRPRRPTAVSAAFEADAGPELGCAGQLERAAEAPNGEVSSLWVGLSVSRSGGRSGLVRRSISRLGLCLFGPSVRAGHQGFVNHRKQEFGRLGSSSCLVVSLRLRLCVFCQHGSFVESTPCSLVPFSRSISIWLAQWRSIGGVLRTRLCHARVTAARSALCAVFGGWESGVL